MRVGEHCVGAHTSFYRVLHLGILSAQELEVLVTV